MFSSSTAARRLTEISTKVTLVVRIPRSKRMISKPRCRTEEVMTLDSSRPRFSYGKIRKVDVKHSVENLVVKSSSVDAEVAVLNVARQQDSAVETDEQDSEMSSLGYGKAQLIPFVRPRVNDDFRRQQVDMEDGESQSTSHKLMKMTVMKRT